MAGKKGSTKGKAKAKPKKSKKIGFAKLTASITKETTKSGKKKYTPEQAKAIAAAVGRKKYGAKKFAKMAQAGKKKASKKRK